MLTRIFFALASAAIVPPAFAAAPLPLTLTDAARNRDVPVELYFPIGRSCTSERQCPVAILSAGYGITPVEYGFLAAPLNRLGYLVVSIDHQLPSDPRLDPDGDRRAQLNVMWRRGAANIGFAIGALKVRYPQFDWRRVVLVGHSLGGDSSAWFATQNVAAVSALVTLDNRRAPLPRDAAVKVLSIRASDTEADPGVLPSEGACIVKIDGSRHNDMSDAGSDRLKQTIAQTMERFLADGSCGLSRP